MIVGDSIINYIDKNNIERRNLFHILETFGLVQDIVLPTYQNDNLLDYIITMIPSNASESSKTSFDTSFEGFFEV